mmetsp:Transcript_17449/g.54132  ORF Transcript_17449/g.54132 Transcript_17449/m.54132 type:complete len:269 (-) Transcript_17449:966-1772(-)
MCAGVIVDGGGFTVTCGSVSTDSGSKCAVSGPMHTRSGTPDCSHSAAMSHVCPNTSYVSRVVPKTAALTGPELTPMRRRTSAQSATPRVSRSTTACMMKAKRTMTMAWSRFSSGKPTTAQYASPMVFTFSTPISAATLSNCTHRVLSIVATEAAVRVELHAVNPAMSEKRTDADGDQSLIRSPSSMRSSADEGSIAQSSMSTSSRRFSVTRACFTFPTVCSNCFRMRRNRRVETPIARMATRTYAPSFMSSSPVVSPSERRSLSPPIW